VSLRSGFWGGLSESLSERFRKYVEDAGRGVFCFFFRWCGRVDFCNFFFGWIFFFFFGGSSLDVHGSGREVLVCLVDC